MAMREQSYRAERVWEAKIAQKVSTPRQAGRLVTRRLGCVRARSAELAESVLLLLLIASFAWYVPLTQPKHFSLSSGQRTEQGAGGRNGLACRGESTPCGPGGAGFRERGRYLRSRREDREADVGGARGEGPGGPTRGDVVDGRGMDSWRRGVLGAERRNGEVDSATTMKGF